MPKEHADCLLYHPATLLTVISCEKGFPFVLMFTWGGHLLHGMDIARQISLVEVSLNNLKPCWYTLMVGASCSV